MPIRQYSTAFLTTASLLPPRQRRCPGEVTSRKIQTVVCIQQTKVLFEQTSTEIADPAARPAKPGDALFLMCNMFVTKPIRNPKLL